LQGDNSVGEFYSVAVTNNAQLADTGTKMIHIGKNTRSTIVSKGISAGRGQNSYRGLVKVLKNAENARNFAVRFASDWRPLRCACLSLHRSSQSKRESGT
jgi:Fe-S cluster assembly protein SufB